MYQKKQEHLTTQTQLNTTITNLFQRNTTAHLH